MLFPRPQHTRAHSHAHTILPREEWGVDVCLRELGIVLWETSTLPSFCEPLNLGVSERLPWELLHRAPGKGMGKAGNTISSSGTD